MSTAWPAIRWSSIQLAAVLSIAAAGVVSSVTIALTTNIGARAAGELRLSIAVGGSAVSFLTAAVVSLVLTGRRRSLDRVETAAGAVRLARDVQQETTEWQTAYRELGAARDLAAAASQAKSEFLSTMSHEIRTPMNAVIGLTEIVLDSDLNPDQREQLEMIRRSGDTLLALINDILDWSKIEAGALELESTVFNIRDCVEDVVHVLASQIGDKDVDLLVDLAANCPPAAVGDQNRLRQVLVNLIGNAVKFTEQGHVLVTVNGQPGQDGPEPVPAQGRAPLDLRIIVADTGIGVAADKMDRLFRDFSQAESSTTRRYGGSGLGLAISHRLAVAMGGQITATSAPGVGSTFTADVRLLMPRTEEIPARATTPAELPGRRALVVDDNPINRTIMASQLASWGMDSVLAASGEQALDLLRGGDRFDIGLFDFHMPGIDGLTLLDRVAALPDVGRLPVIMLTSMTDRGLVRSARHPPDRHLTKPVRSAALRDSLADVMGGAVRTPRPVRPANTAPPVAASLVQPVLTRVLIVEDNPVNLAVAGLMVEGLGYPVDRAVNGQIALDAAYRTPYTVILMDIQMPVMDGLEATRQLRRKPPNGPRPWIIGLTASALVEDRAACTAAGMDDYLSKPVRRNQIADALIRVPRHTDATT